MNIFSRKKLSKIIYRLLRGMYRLAPISATHRSRLKFLLFSSVPWLNHLRQNALLQTTNIYSPKAGIAEEPRVVKQALKEERNVEIIVDGISEWADYESTRDQIEKVNNLKRIQANPKPIPIFSVGSRALSEFAKDIKLPGLTEAPEVSIIIPVFNHIALTLECLYSISLHTEPGISYEVLVADDASSDETMEVLKNIPNIVYLRNAENLGFLRNCNNALKSVRGKYVVFLNNDTQVRPEWLRNLHHIFEEYPDAGAAGPKFVYPNGYLQEAGVAIRHDGMTDMLGLNNSGDLPAYNHTRKVDYVSGACLMVSTSLVKSLGGFSEEFLPCYCEDADLCLQIRQAGYEIYYEPRSVVVHHLSKTTDSTNSNFKIRSIAENIVKLKRKWIIELERLSSVRCIAFYVPGYFPGAWSEGVGITGSNSPWLPVAAAKQQFKGHYQPRFPTDLGFYDQRNPQTLMEQVDLAQKYGITGFCFFSYWSDNKTLWDSPLDQMLSTDAPEMEYCICLSDTPINQSQFEDGKKQSVLDAGSATDGLISHFSQKSYIRIGQRPLILIQTNTQNLAHAASACRNACYRQGINPYIVCVATTGHSEFAEIPLTKLGYDAVVGIPVANQFNKEQVQDFAVQNATQDFPPYPYFPCAIPGWDESPLWKDEARMIDQCSPGIFQAWMEEIMDRSRKHNFGDERIVFIHAWNDWLQGAYLEPDNQFGYSWLEAVQNAVDATTFSVKSKRYLIQ